MSIFFSLIIPVYNVIKYLDTNIASIMCQDFPSDQFEVICIDDGSTDGSSERLDYYKQKHNNLMVVHQQNQGVSFSRNVGISLANGEYVWFIDSDDIIAPDALSCLHFQILKHRKPERLKFGSWACYETVTYEECCSIRSKQQIPNYDYLDSVVWNCILKRQFIHDNNIGFNTSMFYKEDTVFMMTVLSKNPFNIEIKDILYFHRQNPTSLMSSHDKKHTMKRIDSEIEAAKQYRLLLTVQNKHHDSIKKKFGYSILQALSRIQTLEKKSEKEYLNIMREAKLFPCKIPQDCVDRDVFSGRSNNDLYYFLYCHLNTRWGYNMMKALKRVAKIKRTKNRLSSRL